MTWKPDEVIHHSDGSEEWIRYRRSPGNDPARRSRIRKVVGSDRRTREVWHEVVDHTGAVIHADRKPVKGNQTDEGAA